MLIYIINSWSNDIRSIYFQYVWKQGKKRQASDPNAIDPQTKYPEIKLPLNTFQEMQDLDRYLGDTETEQYQDLVSRNELWMNFE